MKDLLEAAEKLSARELETLISDLAEIRSGKEPKVTRQPPGSTDGDIRVIPQDNPTIQARALRDGRIRLWLRHSGLGWLVFNLSVDTCVTMREFFAANTDPNRRPALLGEQNGNGNATH